MSLIVYSGNMLAGKTQHLLQEITKFSDLSSNRHALIINHSIDTRDTKNIISSHSSMYKGLSEKIDVLSIDLLSKVDVTNYTIIGVDEAQFFPDLYDMVKSWISMDKHIICSGLDGDYRMNKFGQISELLPLADKFTKLTAVCSICLSELNSKNEVVTPCNIVPAPFTRKINISSDDIIDIGGSDKYIAVCRKHHTSGF